MKMYRLTLLSFILSLVPVCGVLAKTDFNEKFTEVNSVFNPCTLEIVEFTAIIHLRGGTHEDGSGGVHTNYLEHTIHFEGVGTSSGDTYKLQFFEVGPSTPKHISGKNSGKVTHQDEKFMMNRIGPGEEDGDDWLARFTEHITLNANGVPTAYQLVFNAGTCH